MKKILQFSPAFYRHYQCVLALLCTLAISTTHAAELPFRDDFDRTKLGEDWIADENWSVVSGSAYNPNDYGSLLTSGSFNASSYVIETSVKGLSGSYWREFRLLFGQASTSSSRAYVLSYSPDSGGQLILGRSTDNVYYPERLDAVSIFPALEDARWYKFKISRYRSGLIQVFLDKGDGYSKFPILEAIDQTYSQLGHFGWMVSTQTAGLDFFVGWIDARAPQSEKPAVPEKPGEDDLITQVSAVSGRPYPVAKLRNGAKVYSDRDYQVTSVPSYMQGASFIQTSMEDKSQTPDAWLTTFMKKQVIVYVAYDSRATVLPAWLQGWHKTGDVIGTSDAALKSLDVYSKETEFWDIYPRPFILGANLGLPAQGAKANYLVAAVEQPTGLNLEAEDATLSGVVKANDHSFYTGSGFADFINKNNDYIEWNVQIGSPGTYSVGFKFANASTPRTLALSVDGVPSGNLTFITLTSWDSWAFYSATRIFLKPGTHKIRVAANGTSGPNIDYLSLSFFSADPADAYKGALARIAGPEFIPAVRQEEAAMAYPNPFQQQTTISYHLPEPGKVKLAVYSTDGKMQQVLVDAVQDAGRHEVEFKAGSLATGLYLYQLTHGQSITVGKVLKH
ncbi:T9SS type A sorting domain-containing protein [Dyadobacter sandarakinus]|uniref:T9SS type A sorting domain-containing protein n=1 Tax=Dyadobacter sandarakinus TaxID=2747268 RepID=A0ABX7I5A8_9BACT|nr:T9SS type A sorting domain-containing protein [Dyadobacter sandarakinus]QRR00672.1 T9SS type A sorting domain-containing protein [Dyadobacter sandarakinus]